MNRMFTVCLHFGDLYHLRRKVIQPVALQPTIRRNMPSQPWWKNKPRKKQHVSGSKMWRLLDRSALKMEVMCSRMCYTA